MIIKSFNLSNLNKMDCNLVLLYGENEGQKEEVIKNYFLNNFSGEVFNYDEDQILQSRDTFFENCVEVRYPKSFTLIFSYCPVA